MYQKIAAPMARVYYNKDNPQEPFCLDFGPGTPSIVVERIVVTGRWISCFSNEEDACPKAWMQSAEGEVRIQMELAVSHLIAYATEGATF